MSCPDFLYFCPMHLKKIALLNFKNISQEELALCPGINCLVGDNGAGKTNVVDAVYYLSMCKSSLPMTDGQSIRHGADFFLASPGASTSIRLWPAERFAELCRFIHRSFRFLFLLFLLRLLFTFGEPCRYPVRFLRFLEKISMGSIHK